MSNANPTATHTLVCFAVAEEARPFENVMSSNPHPAVRIAVSGMGRRNARAMIDAELKKARPALVLTCGYAGALHPNLALGQIVFDADPAFPDAPRFQELGGRAVRFLHSDTIIVRSADKVRFRSETGADAVEMESTIIRAACRDQGIPSATVRVISDTASQDMPLDFNALMTPDMKISSLRLGMMLLKSPRRIPVLWAFGRETRRAAEILGSFLGRFLEPVEWSGGTMQTA
jgi:nucleoside phosphorylase